jgi:hypothetical protein
MAKLKKSPLSRPQVPDEPSSSAERCQPQTHWRPSFTPAQSLQHLPQLRPEAVFTNTYCDVRIPLIVIDPRPQAPHRQQPSYAIPFQPHPPLQLAPPALDGYRRVLASSPTVANSILQSPAPMAYNGQSVQPAHSSAVQGYTATSSPEPNEGQQNAQEKPHRRGYQACQNCRSRKVKCDLGSESQYHVAFGAY